MKIIRKEKNYLSENERKYLIIVRWNYEEQIQRSRDEWKL